MSLDPVSVKKYAQLDPEEEALLTSFQRPIVLLDKKLSNPLSDEVSPGNRTVGAMLAYTPLHYLLLSRGFTALVMTSGNISDDPIVIDNDDAFIRLEEVGVLPAVEIQPMR